MQPTISRVTTALVDGSNELCCHEYINSSKLRAMKVIHIKLLLDIIALLVISTVAYRDEGYPDSKFTRYFAANL